MTRLIFLLAILVFSAQSADGFDKQNDSTPMAASKQYPSVYASMGTPLYKTMDAFLRYAHLGEMKTLTLQYAGFMAPIYQYGMELSCREKLLGSERKAYLEQLRTLEEEKKRIMHHLMLQTMKAVDDDDYETFSSLLSLPLDELFTTMSKRVKAINYYKANKPGTIPAMDAMAARVAKQQKTRRAHTAHEPADTARRDYRLKQHLSSSKRDEEPADAEGEAMSTAQHDDPSTLKQIGNMFKSMGIDFDPSLLEAYKSHAPPSTDIVK